MSVLSYPFRTQVSTDRYVSGTSTEASHSQTIAPHTPAVTNPDLSHLLRIRTHGIMVSYVKHRDFLAVKRIQHTARVTRREELCIFRPCLNSLLDCGTVCSVRHVLTTKVYSQALYRSTTNTKPLHRPLMYVVRPNRQRLRQT